MSAGPAPPNPGTPRKAPGASSGGSHFGRRFALGGIAAAIVYALLPARAPQPLGTPSTTFKTPGVRNVENAYANGGATTTHTKGYGGSIQGQKGAAGLREKSGTDKPAGFAHEGMGEEQRPVQPTKVGEAWNEFKYGSAKGK
ncbi:hypothetical protein B0A52_04533 [Exophiala mesophila]|uniref:Uncharacterized protein n=1 Tax=Exophiala mesophila TaxID=212818 RepID=A0A438N9R8_EXOME|nr:hypothetical protein B0A52_04533 [Exophiala mesophila]